MNRLIILLESDSCANLLTALLHSLWQGVAIAGILLLFLRSKAAKDSNVRYVASLAALTAIVLCALFTWAVLEYEPAASGQASSVAALPERTVSDTISIENSQNGNFVKAETFEAEEPPSGVGRSNWRIWAICTWLIGVTCMLLRTVYVAVGGARLRRRCRPLEDEHILALVEQLRKSIGIAQRIRVAVSQHISVPGVLGCVWPTLLLPVSMVSGVPADDLRAILAHELAHVRRYDYLVNFCQMMIEAILFFNPAAWWISKQVRFEREACCDKAGVAATGQRIRYAEVLADWAQRLKSTNVAAPAIGFGKADDSGGMLERVRRIVVAGHRPRLKVSWYVAGITLILSAAVLVGLQQGTTMTVALAGKLLTPQQRIDKITEIEQNHLTFANRDYTQADNITISGSVKTIDGKPLHKRTLIEIYSEGPNHHSSNKSIQISNQKNWPLTKDGTLLLNEKYGVIWLSITSKGYAPAFAGPLKTEPGGEIKGLNFVLDKGFQSALKVVNKDHEPISGAKLEGDYVVHSSYCSFGLNRTTDANGLAVIEYAAKQPAKLTVTVEGYEVETFSDIQLSPENPVVLELTRARETTGCVFSKETGQPVPGASFKVLMINRGSGSHSYDLDYGKTLAVTNDQGRFALRTLRGDSRYLMSVEAAGLGYRILYNVMAGQEDMKVYLPSESRIKGRTNGPLEKLRERDGKHVIGYSFGISYENHSNWTSSKEAIVEVRNGEGRFEITNIKGNRVRIGSGSYREVLNIENELPEEVLIDLTDPAPADGQEYKNRELIVKFDYPEGSPAPQGKLILKYIDPEFATNTYKNQEITIENGRGRFEIPTPGKVAYDNSGIAGYWFDEKSEIKIPYAEDPCTITITTVPAGTIYGEVFEHDGSKAKNVLVGIAVIEKSPLMGESPFLDVDGKNSAGDSDIDARYVISPLPLGGKYVIVAHTGDLYMVSEQVELDETRPIRKLDMTLPEGRTLELRILDENGKPKPSVPVRFDFDLQNGHGFSRQARYTDIEGKVVIDRFNPKVPGIYRVVVKDVPGYRPLTKDVENFDEPLEIKLERGKVVKGNVIDDETGWPIPGAEVYALPTDFSIPEPTTYLDADNVTDEQGRFKFSTMARREYQLHVRSAQLTNHRNGGIITGGDQKEITLQVKLSKWSNLKPRKPVEQNN